MSVPLRVLLLEDSAADELLLLRELKKCGFAPEHVRVETAGELEAALDRQTWDLVIADYNLPTFSGMAALQIIRMRGLTVPVILVSGSVDEPAAVEAMRAGAQDYMLKSKLFRLGPAIERELRQTELRKERARLQEELLHAQRIECVGRLAGGISHDFNNVLSGIIGFTDVGLLYLEDHPKPEAAREAVREIRELALRGATLTRQLLDFSRKQVLHNEVLHVNPMLREMQAMLHPLLGRSIELVCRLDPGLAPVVADRSKLEQVILNLVVNARDAVAERETGTITIQTRNVDPSDAALTSEAAPPGSAFILISVSDTGSGMSAETRAHLFEPYFTTKPPGKGTGLGLATVDGIVKQCGGFITVDSLPGRGSAFSIYLPAAASQKDP